jgi:hypothetical protein
MATNVGVVATKNADGSYSFTSIDTTNAKPWHVKTDPGDRLSDLKSVKDIIWNETLRQIQQL